MLGKESGRDGSEDKECGEQSERWMIDIGEIFTAEEELYARTISKGIIKWEEMVREIKGMPPKVKNKVPTNCKTLMTHIADCDECKVTITSAESPTQTVGYRLRVTGASWFVQLCAVGREMGKEWWGE